MTQTMVFLDGLERHALFSTNVYVSTTRKSCVCFYNKRLFSAALSAMLIPSDDARLEDCSINPLDWRYITKASSALPSPLFSLSTQHPRSLLFYIYGSFLYVPCRMILVIIPATVATPQIVD